MEGVTVKIAWLGLFVEIITFSLIKPFISDFEVAAFLLIGINLLFVVIGISKYGKRMSGLFYSAFIIRMLAMFWDIYFRSIFTFPGSGADSEGYLLAASRIASDISIIKSNIYGGFYSKILGVLFYITAPERLLGQYVNVLLGLTIIIITYKTLTLLDINERAKKLSTFLICFFPNAIIHSGILLRENFIAFFVVVSFYFFIKWFKYGLNEYIFYSITFILLASIFHSGVIGIIVGYAFMYMFYKHKTNEFKFNKKTIFIFIFFLIISYFVYVNYSDVFMAKFKIVEEMEDVYNVANSRRGGSAYLMGLKIDSWWKMILFSPIKMFYFLTSPLPMDWRGLNDIIAFFIDSIVYLFLFYFFLRNFKKCKTKKPLIVGIAIMLLVPIFVFGVGVTNAGTAMRHRHKIFPIIIVLFAMVYDVKMSLRASFRCIISNALHETHT